MKPICQESFPFPVGTGDVEVPHTPVVGSVEDRVGNALHRLHVGLPGEVGRVPEVDVAGPAEGSQPQPYATGQEPGTAKSGKHLLEGTIPEPLQGPCTGSLHWVPVLGVCIGPLHWASALAP